jgi:two-component system chemotaxis response regulator CheB
VIVETSSVVLREQLLVACNRLAASVAFSSVSDARQALLTMAPAVCVVGAGPFDAHLGEFLREMVGRGMTAFACVNAQDVRTAMQSGAADSCERNEAGVQKLTIALAGILVRTSLRASAIARASLPVSSYAVSTPERFSVPPRQPPGCRLIAIGAANGGPDALEFLLARLPVTLPTIVIVQHLAATQTAALVERLAFECKLKVREARHGDRLDRGLVLVAPGGQHLRMQPGGLGVEITTSRPGTRHLPSVDVFFETVACELAERAVGVLLTGMGDDGAQGLLAMRRAGAHTIAQNEASSTVYGMARRAVELDAAESILALNELPDRLARLCGTTTSDPQSLRPSRPSRW